MGWRRRRRGFVRHPPPRRGRLPADPTAPVSPPAFEGKRRLEQAHGAAGSHRGAKRRATHLLKTVGCGLHQPQKRPLPMHVAQFENDEHDCAVTTVAIERNDTAFITQVCEKKQVRETLNYVMCGWSQFFCLAEWKERKKKIGSVGARVTPPQGAPFHTGTDVVPGERGTFFFKNFCAEAF